MPHVAANEAAIRLPEARSRQTQSVKGACFGLLHGGCAGMRELYALIGKVAPTDVTVLIVGESGCGKELVAQTIHQRSRRSGWAFVPVNCGAIPRNLIEAELFGFEKGAFTGATHARAGLFECAGGGTLLLDEITEMAPEMQVRLLRVLETGKFTRVGGDVELPVDVRIIAATNRDPAQAVADGVLREDLMYRLAVFPLTLPPLRARGDGDIALLADYFVDEFNADAETSKRLSVEAADELLHRSWPGNVRELRNCLQRACILADDVVRPEHLTPTAGTDVGDEGEWLRFAVGTPLAEMERQTIFATLEHCGGDKKRAAELLGVSLKTLYNRLTGYGADDVCVLRSGSHA